jgi:hypothetical protein
MRWPWELNAFDSRIMSAWPGTCAVWALTMYFMKDWAEVKIGVRALLIFILALFVIWIFTFSGFDPARKKWIDIWFCRRAGFTLPDPCLLEARICA